MEKILSIVVIGRNEERNLSEVFDSVNTASARFREGFKEDPERVYVDSRSTDRSVEIARSHGIVCLSLKGKTSPAKARNLGAASTASRYLFFLDGDTLLDPDFLPAGVSYLEENKNLGGVGGILKFRIFRKNSTAVEFENYWHNRRNGEAIYDGVGGTFLYRRSAFLEAGGFSPGLPAGEEFDLMLRMTSRGAGLRRILVPMAIHLDWKSAEHSFARRYLLSSNIFLPGEIVRRAPVNSQTINIMLRRFWLHILYLPLIVAVIVLLFTDQSVYSLGLLLVALGLNLVYKNFSIKRGIISAISMVFFSFGWWSGLLTGNQLSRK